MPDPGRITTKMQLRAEFSKEVSQLCAAGTAAIERRERTAQWEAAAKEEAPRLWASLSSPGVVKALGGYMARLAPKPQAKL
jgi:hypothetical protein